VISFSLVIPCYNEVDNLPTLLDRARMVLAEEKLLEIVLVDNGSTDGSGQLLRQMMDKVSSERLRVVTIKQNLGYGWGILCGLDSAQGDILAWTHADLQTDIGDVLVGIRLFVENAKRNTLVKGTRRNRRLGEKFFSWGMEKYASIRLRCLLSEINAQPKVFSKQFYCEFIQGRAPHDFSLDLFVQYQAQRYGQVLEFPVFFNPRLHGESKGGGSSRTRWKLIERTNAYIGRLAKELNL